MGERNLPRVWRIRAQARELPSTALREGCSVLTCGWFLLGPRLSRFHVTGTREQDRLLEQVHTRSSRRPALSPAGRGISRVGSDMTRTAEGGCPHRSLVLPALQVCSWRCGLFHVLDHFREVVLTDSRRWIDIASIAMGLAYAEIETATIVRVGGR